MDEQRGHRRIDSAARATHDSADRTDALPNPFLIDRPTANPTPSPDGPPAVADPSADQAAKAFTEALIKGFADLPLPIDG